MENYKNDFIARGTVIAMTLKTTATEMRKKVKASRTERFEILEETVPTEVMNGIIKMRSNDDILTFTIKLIKQAPNFTAGVRQKEFVGYKQMLDLYKKFQAAEDEGKELRVQLRGHLEDGTFWSDTKGDFVEQMKWCVEYVNYNPSGSDLCRAMLNAAYYNGRVYIAPSFGNTVLPLLGKKGITNKRVSELLKSGKTINMIIERHCEEVESEEGYITYKRVMLITSATEAEDKGVQYGYVRQEYCELSESKRADFLEKKRAEAA